MNIDPGALEMIRTMLNKNKRIKEIITKDDETVLKLEEGGSESFYKINKLGDTKNGSIQIGPIDSAPGTETIHFLDKINYDPSKNAFQQQLKKEFYISMKDQSAANKEAFLKGNKSETHICKISFKYDNVEFSRLDKKDLKSNLRSDFNQDQTFTILKDKLNLSDDDINDLYEAGTTPNLINPFSTTPSENKQIEESLQKTKVINGSRSKVNPGVGTIQFGYVVRAPQSIVVVLSGNAGISAICQTIIQKKKKISPEKNQGYKVYLKSQWSY